MPRPDVITRVRALFAEDPDEPLPREWIALALAGSGIAFLLGLARNERSGFLLLRWAADDFLLNVLAGLALIGPGLALTNVVARRLAVKRRMADAGASLRRLVGLASSIADAVEVAHRAVAGGQPRPAPAHRQFTAEMSGLIRYLRGATDDLTRVPRDPACAAGAPLSPSDESALIPVNRWPAAGAAAGLAHDIDRLAASFGAVAPDPALIAELDEVIGRRYPVWEMGPGAGTRFRQGRAPLRDGTLLSPAEYAAAAAGLAGSGTALVEAVIDMLPRSVGSRALPAR